MKSFFLTLATGFMLSGMGLAFPVEGTDSQDPGFLAFLSKRATISTDNTCGNSFAGANNSYSCDATVNTGGCCSAYGYCGNTTGMFANLQITCTCTYCSQANLCLPRLLRNWLPNCLWNLYWGNSPAVREHFHMWSKQWGTFLHWRTLLFYVGILWKHNRLLRRRMPVYIWSL